MCGLISSGRNNNTCLNINHIKILIYLSWVIFSDKIMSKQFEFTITPWDCGSRQIFVRGHKKKDGTIIRPYCRDVPSSGEVPQYYEGPMTKKEVERMRYENMMRGFE